MKTVITLAILSLGMGIGSVAEADSPVAVRPTQVPATPARATSPRPIAAPQPARSAAVPRGSANDPPVRMAQGGPSDFPAIPSPTLANDLNAMEGSGTSLSLQAALYGALSGNPDLNALRNNNIASPESVEVARRFPTTLNPTLWVDVRPFVYERNPGHDRSDRKDALYYFSWRQPVELGHQTTHRYEIAKAAYSQQQWTVVQAELLSLVQTFRFFQTAAYRREKLRVAKKLADSNDHLLQSLQRRFEANQVRAADVSLAKVENRAARQQVKAAQQDYTVALTDLRNQIGVPETAGTAEPLGEFLLPGYIPPLEDQALIQLALQSRPEIHAARAAVAGACAAVNLAKGDRIPTPVVGPVYERDEQGTQFLGFVYITPIPIINSGKPLVIQRQADYRRAVAVLQQAEQRTIAQVKAAVAKWNGSRELVSDSYGLTAELNQEVNSLERLFDAGQTDLTILLQARQRLIQLRNAELDALWQATQAQADLLTALGAPALIGTMLNRETGAVAAPPPPPAGNQTPSRPPSARR